MAAGGARASLAQQGESIDLPTSKRISEPVPGSPERSNGLPVVMAVSPDGRYVVSLHAGYGTADSKYEQSMVVTDLQQHTHTDVPDGRTGVRARQTFFNGLAFSTDGAHLYATLDSLSAPEADGPRETGNAVAVYGFRDGAITFEKLLHIPLQKLAPGHRQTRVSPDLQLGEAVPYPAGICVVRSAKGDRLLIADNMSDDALLLDAATGTTITRFDLSSAPVVPAAFPIAVTATRDGRRGFVALWNSSAVVSLDLMHLRVESTLPLLRPASQTASGSHPMALALSRNERTLYVALANRDMVAAVDTRSMTLDAMYDTRLPGQSYFGAQPDAVAVSPDGHKLYVANSGSNAIAVFRTVRANSGKPARPMGFVPTEWLPTALAISGDSLVIGTAKGTGTGPNNFPQAHVEGSLMRRGKFTYIATLLHGSIATVNRSELETSLAQSTAQVLDDNRMHAAEAPLPFAHGTSPIRHIIYVIRENRTFDQILGDEPAANSDPKLVMYGRDITPNFHKLVEQFGILDNFYDSAEVSGDGHVWSNAAISSDYTERTWQQSYRGAERTYDYEGVVAEGFPLLENIPDVNEPSSGYLWTNLAAHGKSLFHFGEYVATRFCGIPEKTSKQQQPTLGTPEPGPQPCARNSIAPGEAIPAIYGGGTNQYAWPIPLISQNIATKPELQGHFDPEFPDFELSFPDELRVRRFLQKLEEWKADRAAGHDTMPSFIQLRLPNDHTAGTRPGMPRPAASIADNDLAVGMTVDAISHSPFWEDTAIFVLEDDAQNGADHVDAHRSVMLVASKYAPHTASPRVDHNFYTTVSAIRTMERLLGLPPMNNNDAFAPLMSPEFAGAGDQPAFTADPSNRENGLIYEANKFNAPGAEESSKMDFSHADRADSAKLNVILWRDAKGNAPLPYALKHPPHTKRKDDDD